MKKTAKPSGTIRESRRLKCACASCQCTVDMDQAVRKGNLVFCGTACAEKACTIEDCRCEHDHCSAA